MRIHRCSAIAALLVLTLSDSNVYAQPSVVDRSALSGCADAEREGFIDEAIFPELAGCAGAWRTAGMSLVTGKRMPEGCADNGGDDRSPLGFFPATEQRCNVEDLCASGWHVCMNDQEVLDRLPDTKACGSAPVANGVDVNDTRMFFATRQSGPGLSKCGLADTNRDGKYESVGADDIFGCGNLGERADASTCRALSRATGNGCAAVGLPWTCGDSMTATPNELLIVTKPGSRGGGVLCCRDSGFTPTTEEQAPEQPVYSALGGGGACALRLASRSSAFPWALVLFTCLSGGVIFRRRR